MPRWIRRGGPGLGGLLLCLALVACASGSGGPGDDDDDDVAMKADASVHVDASDDWSCFESPGTLCLCDTGKNRELEACSPGWTCCLTQDTEARQICECYDKDEEGCAATIAMDPSLARIDACPPGVNQ